MVVTVRVNVIVVPETDAVNTPADKFAVAITPSAVKLVVTVAVVAAPVIAFVPTFTSLKLSCTLALSGKFALMPSTIELSTPA